MSFASNYSRFVMKVYRTIWLGSMESRLPEIPPGSLILAAHYNGLVDGFVYGSQLPPARGIISVQWHKRLIGRLLFPGIAVQRSKDAGKGGDNLHAFRQMTAALASGERLLFFPEGTSRLGTARLPIARGTLLLLKSIRKTIPRPAIFFSAAHYHAPTLWKSPVTVGWIGPVALPESSAIDGPWVSEHLLAAQSAAYTQPAPRSYGLTSFAALLALPYLPLWWLVRRFAHEVADENNVISLWKFLFGVPSTILLFIAFTAAATWTGLPVWLPAASLFGGWLLWNR